jgi:hypothetical protein
LVVLLDQKDIQHSLRDLRALLMHELRWRFERAGKRDINRSVFILVFLRRVMCRSKVEGGEQRGSYASARSRTIRSKH